jgi:cyclase
MPFKRLIPVLLLNNEELIHRKKYESSSDKYVGDPINTINVFNQYEVDELTILDISTRKNNNEICFDLLSEISGEAFFPLSYGGGINKIDDAKKIINLGFEKVVLNNSILDNFGLLEDCIKYLGSQSVVVSIDIVLKNKNYMIYDYIKKKTLDISLFEYISMLNNIKVGEILFSLIDLDGTMLGHDSNFISLIQNKVEMPIIYKGGLKNYNDLKDVFKFNIDAVASSTIFIMKKINGGIVLNYPTEQEKNFYIYD